MADSGVLAFVIFALIFCYLCSGISSGPCNFNVKIKQVLRNDGFHRNLTYGIVFNADDERSRWLLKGCFISLDQDLPNGVYANPDGIEDYRRANRLNAIVKNKVNIEMPAEDAQPTSVYVFGKVTASKVNLWLPVHARYHRAKAGGGSARIEIGPPKLYLRCPDQRLDACTNNLTQSTFLCSGGSNQLCSWIHIPYTIMNDVLTWSVPIGDLGHYYIVSIGTAAVIVIGTLYLIRIIHQYKIDEKRKKQY